MGPRDALAGPAKPSPELLAEIERRRGAHARERAAEDHSGDTPIEEVCRMAFVATTKLPSQQHVSRVREERAVYLPAWTAA